jgi:hypothetical protein
MYYLMLIVFIFKLFLTVLRRALIESKSNILYKKKMVIIFFW